jgi:hypothetical protein
VPNHCENYLSVSGPEAEVECFIAEVVVTGDDLSGGNGSVLDANKILPCPEECDDVYDWCVERWGTKWSGYFGGPLVHEKQASGQAVVQLEFCTAWSPFSVELYEILSRRFPELVISCRYIEAGMCFTGVTTVRSGEVLEATCEPLKPCHYGELKAESPRVWVVVDRKEAAAVVEGPEDLVPVLQQMWGDDEGWFYGELPPPLPDRVARMLGDRAVMLHKYFFDTPTSEEINALHARVAEVRRHVLEPTQEEAIALLAHPAAEVRDHALKRFQAWKQQWHK